MPMEINEIIGNNLAELRKAHGMTQREVAVKLDFSDKSVSKWESGESIPSIDVLVKLAQLYSVKLDYFVSETHDETQKEPEPEPQKPVSRYRYNRLVISLLSILVVWIVVIAVFIFTQNIVDDMWILFVWAVVVSLVMAVIFNSIWGKMKDTFVILSVLVWCTLTAIFLQMLVCGNPFWQIYLLGIPLQLGVILWASLLLKNKSHDPATIRAKREYQKEKGLKKKQKQEERAQHKKELKEQKKQKNKTKQQNKQKQQNNAENINITQTTAPSEHNAPTKLDEPQKAPSEQQATENTTPNDNEKFVHSKNENIIQDLK